MHHFWSPPRGVQSLDRRLREKHQESSAIPRTRAETIRAAEKRATLAYELLQSRFDEILNTAVAARDDEHVDTIFDALFQIIDRGTQALSEDLAASARWFHRAATILSSNFQTSLPRSSDMRCPIYPCNT